MGNIYLFFIQPQSIATGSTNLLSWKDFSVSWQPCGYEQHPVPRECKNPHYCAVTYCKDTQSNHRSPLHLLHTSQLLSHGQTESWRRYTPRVLPGSEPLQDCCKRLHSAMESCEQGNKKNMNAQQCEKLKSHKNHCHVLKQHKPFQGKWFYASWHINIILPSMPRSSPHTLKLYSDFRWEI